ncbi:TIGR00730 family Rossman fold protein [Saccharomonospora sp. NPDC006951]
MTTREDRPRRICVFCGSSSGNRPRYAEDAAALGTLLAERGIGLVFGGGQVGLMGVVADAALAAGGEVIGVIPKHLMRAEIAHHGLTELHVVKDMHERKATMAELSDGFLALPGGAGTLEELFEVWTWAQLGLHAKPLGLVDVGGYYTKLAAFIEHMVDEGFLNQPSRELISIDSDAAVLLDSFAAHQAVPVDKWAG